MRNPLLGIIIFTFLAIVNVSFTDKLEKYYINQIVKVTFNSRTTFDDLAKVKSEMKNKGIAIDYIRIEFNEGGGLRVIKLKVDCKDGFSGTASSKVLTPESQFGFKRDYSQNSDDPFTVGNLDN